MICDIVIFISVTIFIFRGVPFGSFPGFYVLFSQRPLSFGFPNILKYLSLFKIYLQLF